MKLFKGKKLLFKSVHIAAGFMDRFLGLMGKTSVPGSGAMYFPSCNSIHTYFMKIPIDVIMLDSKGRVVFMRENMGPWRMAMCSKAKDTMEMKAGNIKALKLKPDDVLSMK